MPSRDEHLAQARHNTQFYTTVDKGTFRDWAVTVLFYTGLHYVDALFAEKRNIHPTSHTARSDEVARSTELRPVYVNYEALKNASYNARYKPPTRFSAGFLNDLENRHLARVREAVGRHIAI